MSKFIPCAKNTNVSPIIFNTFYYKQHDINIYVKQIWQGIPYLGGICIHFYKKTLVLKFFEIYFKYSQQIQHFCHFYITFNI